MLSSAYPLEGRVCENASPALEVSADDPAHPNHLLLIACSPPLFVLAT
jgi:hypothetical protein